MRLVTYRDTGGFQRAGALLEKDQLVLDLQVASETIHGHARPEFASVLALVEAGEGALDAVRALVQRTPASAVLARTDVHLCAPIQPPPQIRDCSCFELHLRQSFAAARRMRVAREPRSRCCGTCAGRCRSTGARCAPSP